MTKYQIRDFIDQHQDIFRTGNVFNENLVLTYFGVEQPDLTGNTILDYRNLTRFKFKKLDVQTKINRVLAKRGMYMSQTDYTNFYVRDSVDTIQRVDELRNEGASKIVFSNNLQRNIRRYGSRWTRVSDEELR